MDAAAETSDAAKALGGASEAGARAGAGQGLMGLMGSGSGAVAVAAALLLVLLVLFMVASLRGLRRDVAELKELLVVLQGRECAALGGQ